MGEQDIISLIASDNWMMHVLQTAQSLRLPDWCVCAGFIRSKVWDYLHGFAGTRLPDVDVAYFDPNRTDESAEKEYEKILKGLDSSVPWSVKNQARMHTKNGHVPYTSTADGLSNFPEVCTAIGAYLDSNGQVSLVAPYGVDDLVNLVVRPTPFFISQDKRDIYEQRVATKGWSAKWHRLRILHP
ncbi:nucleotidyltransferase family protein [Alicyclobacillus acidiphilus]|uniref:nucleotidyltransferase family protein n=1 Tax=Alicyclobacillus acidiphilus TaxID=182455 RepID=UPI00083105A4|nr:nucleotidyltransferase family protein [Alicyclobacillus acidiphilus]